MTKSDEWRVASGQYLRRKKANTRFCLYGQTALGLALLLLVLLMGSIIWQGIGGFQRAEVTLTIDRHPAGCEASAQDPARSCAHASGMSQDDYQQIVRAALLAHFPDITSKDERRDLYTLLSIGAPFAARDALAPLPLREGVGGGVALQTKSSPVERPLTQPSPSRGEGKQVRLPATDNVTLWLKGKLSPEMTKTRFTPRQLEMLEKLKADGLLKLHFNSDFFTTGDSREPELAGYAVGMVGSLWMILVCLGLALPLGVMTAVYLEEFAPRHWFNDMIEVNINNLAAVPSIVFGLLGLALYLNLLGMPRGSALVGGLTLALMVLPVIIIATRAALRAVPPSIRDAARGLGASELQVVLHHVLPLALPGIMTGVILGVARALGETAPLLMIGMVAFIADVPHLATDPATVMPVQIYLWASSPEIGFVEKTAAAIMVLLVMLLTLNLTAVWLRNRFERRW